MNWSMVKLSDVAPAKASKPTVSIDEKVWTLNLDQVEANTGRILHKIMAPVSEAGTSTHGFDERHVLYSKLRPYLNKVVIPDEQGLATTELVPMLPDPLRLDRKYLAYYLRSKKFVNWVSSQVAGAKMPRVSMQLFWQHEIPLPSLSEQKRITAILDKGDAIHRKRKQAIQLCDEFLHAVFLDIFGDPVTNPKGWETKTIEQLISDEKYALKRGPFGGALKKEIFVEDGYLIYEQYHALNSDFSFQRYFIDEDKYQELKAFDVKPRDIIISCSGVNLGRLAEVPDGSPKGIINQALMKITLNQKVMLNQLFIEIFSNPSFKEAFYGDFRGAAIPNFPPMSIFKEFKFIVPPLDIQKKYINIREKLLKNSLSSDSSADSSVLFEALSQKAFLGKL